MLTWLLGEFPEREPQPGSGALAMVVATTGALSLYFGMRHKLRDPPMLEDTWTLLVYGALPLAVLVWWELGRRGRLSALFGSLTTAATIAAPIAFKTVRRRLTKGGSPLLAATLFAITLLFHGARRGGVKLGLWGIGQGDSKWWLPRFALLAGGTVVLVSVSAVLFPSLLAYYPKSDLARESLSGLLQVQASELVYMIGWEFFFRGFLLFGLARRDPLLAVLFQAMPFFLMHRGKPKIEMLSSFVGGCGLGWFTLRAGSILPAVLLHWMMISVMEIIGFAVRSMGA